MKTRKPAQYSYKSKRNEQPEKSSIPDGEAVRGHTKMIMLTVTNGPPAMKEVVIRRDSLLLGCLSCLGCVCEGGSAGYHLLQYRDIFTVLSL